MPTRKQARHVVGIGASAGGLESIQALLTQAPDKLGNTALVIAQHLSPDYKSMLVELLARRTKVPVVQIEDGMRIEPNHIYIAPPSDDVLVEDKTFHLKKAVSVGAHPSIDALFNALAKEYGNHSIGIVLSGTGKDGSKGAAGISRAGGVVIAQEPSTARYEGMPEATIETGLANHILSPDDIGKRLLDFVDPESRSKQAAEKKEPVEVFPQIFNLLEHRIGIDFSDYKISTLSRRLDKRIAERNFKNEDEYLAYIRKHPDELDQLFESLLIGVTEFFRDSETFEAIQDIVTQMVEDKKSDETLRIWIPGCATGEEAYTFAMLLCEAIEKTGKRIPFQLFATDIDIKALHKARLGVYDARAVKHVPKDLLRRHFKKLNETTYEVHKDLRKFVLFSRHDVTANPPFLRLDLISCRNLMIYFNNDLQKKVLPLFYYALNPQGYMVLGKSENIGNFQRLFSVTHAAHKIFRRKNDSGRSIKFPELRLNRKDRSPQPYMAPAKEVMSVIDMVKETLYSTYDHPFIVADDSMDIVEIHGDISPFIKLKPGNANLNANKQIIPELQIELRAIMGTATASGKPATGKIRKIDGGDKPNYLRLSVKPLLHTQPNAPYYLIMFEKLELEDSFLRMSKEVMEDQESPRVIELEHDLDATKEHMNSLLEELETSNEELQALNEEMQASNEELQASNEELETSNEELQATNEELENAYGELRQASDQIESQKSALEHAAENLTTLLNNTLVGFILIDRNYKVLASNKTARTTYKRLFNVQIKENSSFIKLLPDNVFADFHAKFKKALAGKQVVSEESFTIKDAAKSVHYYDFNYTPVKRDKSEKEARHIAISFADITRRKQAELELIASNNELAEEKDFKRALTESLPSVVWTANAASTFTTDSEGALTRLTGKKWRELRSKGWAAFVHPEDLKDTLEEWHSSVSDERIFIVQHRLLTADGKYRWYLTKATPVKHKGRKLDVWVGSSTEIESIRKKEEMERNVERLRQQRNELVEIGKVKDEFIGLASHQLRTPATAVKQYLSIVMNEYAGPISTDQLQYLQTAYNSNERQLNVINDLLKTAQLDTKGFSLNIAQHNLHELLSKIVEELQPMFDLKKQTVALEGPADIAANIDHEELKLALTNLVENASKYSYPQGNIVLGIKPQKNAVLISVRDEGVGIPEQDQHRIFDKFTRIDNDLSDTVSGSGLGLYWVKRIVKLHGGKISIQSKPKQGSTFIVELPA